LTQSDPEAPRGGDAHPVVDAALRALSKGPAGSYQLPEKGRAALDAAMGKYRGKPGLMDAARALVTFAYMLSEKLNSRDAADTVIAIARKGLPTGAQALLAGKRYKEFLGASATPLAPSAASVAPAGSIKAGTLFKPALPRRPPRAK
jgi:hypothetical protein